MEKTKTENLISNQEKEMNENCKDCFFKDNCSYQDKSECFEYNSYMSRHFHQVNPKAI